MSSITMAEQEADVEQRLLQIEENFITASPLACCTVEIAVQDVGAWVVKFRETGVLFNRKDLIFTDAVTPDAKVVFTSYEAFCELAGGAASLEDLRAQGRAEAFHRDEAFTPGLGRLFYTLQNRDSGPLVSPGFLRSAAHPASSSLSPQADDATAANPNAAIKAGWCYKKRDIIMGWRCRYMQVFPGRVEYFRDEHDVIPRGVIPLLGADVKGPKKCAVNGNDEHWSLTIEPKHKDKQFRLASLRTGEEGLVETVSWIQALVHASRAASDPEGTALATAMTSPASAAGSPHHLSGQYQQSTSLPPFSSTAAGGVPPAPLTAAVGASGSPPAPQPQRLRRNIIGSVMSVVHGHQHGSRGAQHTRSGTVTLAATQPTGLHGTSGVIIEGSSGSQSQRHGAAAASSQHGDDRQSHPHLTREASGDDEAFVYRDAKSGLRRSKDEDRGGIAGEAGWTLLAMVQGLSEDLGLPAIALPLVLAVVALGCLAFAGSSYYLPLLQPQGSAAQSAMQQGP